LNEPEKISEPNGPPEPIQETGGWKGVLVTAAMMALFGAGAIALMGAAVRDNLPGKTTERPMMGIVIAEPD